jgi:hypothetical protein
MNRAYLLLPFAFGICGTASASESERSFTFEGRYEFRSDSETLEVLGKQVCFYPSGPTAAIVPRPKGDHRLPWFCFANSKSAAHMLGFKLIKDAKSCGSFGNATVTVSNYKRYTGESDGSDIATLTVVLSKAPARPLPCQE